MKNIFIIGSKGIPARYGGFETFVDKLTYCKKNNNIKYHVACLANDEKEFMYNNARCFNVKIKDIGKAKAIIYDIKALRMSKKYIKDNNLEGSIIYILASRIGPFLAIYKRSLKNQGIKVYVNPDGHEWKRSKWSKFVQKYWKLSEMLMAKHADLVVCDSKGIEEYIIQEYGCNNDKTTFIAYGADIEKSKVLDTDKSLMKWYKKNEIRNNEYYLVVARFVPENNFETIIREFMNTGIDRDLVIVTNNDKNKFYEELLNKTSFSKDKRIKFVGTVYEQDLIKKIRENAYGYIHGHEVGGTNPSLLEALASTKLNLLLDVNFNREVGQTGALYFSREKGDLATLINKVELLDKASIEDMGNKAKKRIIDNYTWNQIVDKYEELFYSYGLEKNIFKVANNINCTQYGKKGRGEI